MNIENWLKQASDDCLKANSLELKSLDFNEKVTNTISNFRQACSEQWMETHDVVGNQVEEGFTRHSKLFSAKIDVIEIFINVIKSPKINHNFF